MAKTEKQADVLIGHFLKFMDVPNMPYIKRIAADCLIDCVNEFQENYNYQIKIAKKLAKKNLSK